MNDDDISKLPKWAQSRIRIMQGQIKELQDELRSRSGVKSRIVVGYEDTDSVAHYMTVPATYIKNHETVRFKVVDQVDFSFIDTGFYKNLNYKDLESIRIVGSRNIIVEPESGNVVRISLHKWR